MTNFVMGILSITIGAVVLASVFMSTIHTSNTTGWSTSEIALWGLLGIVGIAGLVYGVMAVFGLG